MFSSCEPQQQNDDCQHYHPVHHQAKAATCISQGNIQFWHCKDCGTYFSDRFCEHPITEAETVIDIDPNNHKYQGAYTYDYDEMEYVRTCAYNNEHVEKVAAGNGQYPILVRNADELQKAIAKNGYIKLENDITLDSGVKIQSKNKVEINLNGKTVSGSAEYLFYIDIGNVESAFTRIKNGTIKNTNTSEQCYGLYIVDGANKSSVYLDNCVIEVNEQGQSNGVGVYISRDDAGKTVTVELTNSTVKASFAGVYFDGPSRFVLNKTDVTAGAYGIYDNYGSNAEMTDGSITAPIGVRSLYIFTMTRGTITATELAISVKYSTYDYPRLGWDEIPPDSYFNMLTLLQISGATITSSGTGIELQTAYAYVKNTSINTAGDSIKVFRDVLLIMDTCQLISENGMGIVGNGTVDINNENCGIDTHIQLTDCSIAATWGVYLPQTDGIFTMTGGKIQASVTGIEIRAGKATLKGVEIESTAQAFSTSENAATSACILGAAVAVSQGSTNNDIEVTIRNCTLKGVYAFYEADLIDSVSENLTVTFEGTNTIEGDVYSQNCDSIPEATR